MAHPASRLIALILVAVGAPKPAHADSDGYYCTGPNYLAYQLSLGATTTGHFLYVVALRDSAPVGQPTRVSLPFFQVHGMRCTASTVELLGWDSLYTVTLDARPSVSAVAAPWVTQGASRRAPAEYGDLNLGAWSRAAKVGKPDTVALGARATRYRFVLAIDVGEIEEQCRSHVVTRLLQLNASSHVVATLTLFDGEATRECGE